MNSNYIEKIFGKSRDEITIIDIKNYFSSPQEESSIVEFKSGQVEIIDVYKEITAFLNTEGGLLIIGSPREKVNIIGKSNVKICEGDLTYSNFKNKDWLYQKIASNIVPFPTSLKIEEFLTEEGNVFLIDIPQSQNPPHQCSADGKYYLRLERDAKPAPHGIIQALFNKRRVPLLNVEIEIEELEIGTDKIKVRINNISQIPAEKVSFLIDVYNIAQVDSSYDFILQKDVFGNKFSMSNSTSQVLVQIVSLPIEFKVSHFNKEYLIFVGFWCRDRDFDFRYLTYSPIVRKIITEGTLDEGELLTNVLDRIS